MYNMQDLQRQISPIELELERVRKFSIIDCIRNEVKEVFDKLPKKSDTRFQKKIDGVIRRNLLKERKVRFGIMNDKRDEPEKDALEEIDVILQVLGNDKNNKLVIENFELLERRIRSVEQRLSGLLRSVPEIRQTERPTVKIDAQRVKTNMQEFVNMFNHVFTSTYEILTNTNSSVLDETLSSKNRLKFHLLSHLTELKESESTVQIKTNKDAQANDNSAKKLAKGKFGSKGHLNKSESKVELPVVKAVDSLIALRERFKAQSAKWKQLKLNKKINEAEEKTKKSPTIKKFLETSLKKKEDIKASRKFKEKYFSDESFHGGSLVGNHSFDITEDLLDINYIEKAINDSLRRNTRDSKEADKKNENKIKRKSLTSGTQKVKDLIHDPNLAGTKELIKSYVDKNVLRKPIATPNTKEKLTKIPIRYTSTNRLDAQNELRKGKLSKITNRYASTPTVETLYEKYPARMGMGLRMNNDNVLKTDKHANIRPRYNTVYKLDSLDKLSKENIVKRASNVITTFELNYHEKFPRQITKVAEETPDTSDTIIPLYKRESLPDDSENSATVLTSEEILSKQLEQNTEKLPKDSTTQTACTDITSQTSPSSFFQTSLTTDIAGTGTALSKTNSQLLLKENEILNSLIADIRVEISKSKKENAEVVKTAEISTKESQDIKEELPIKEVIPKDSKVATENEKLSKIPKVPNTITSADTKEKLVKHTQKRSPISVLQAKERQTRDTKRPDKNKAKELLAKPKDTTVSKSIKTKLNTFRKEQQPASMKVTENGSNSLRKPKPDYKNILNSMLKGSDASIEVLHKTSSNLSTADSFSKTSLSLLSELKLQPNKATRYRPAHQKA